MRLLLSSSSILPSSDLNRFELLHSQSPINRPSNPSSNFVHFRSPKTHFLPPKFSPIVYRNRAPRNSTNAAAEFVDSSDHSFVDQETEDVEDIESPWEGAVLYRRDASVTHLEYCTTLERLALSNLSTEVSKSRASLMGLRVTKAVKDFPEGTPVLLSLDVTRKKQKLRLDGILRTVITLGCSRCGGPAAESIYSNFSLLLTEEPIEEPEVINMGVIFGEDGFKTSDTEEYDDNDIDLDDRLYFPPEKKSIDISKNIRDLVHVEITYNAVCDQQCRGLCLNCGTNLNNGGCDCSREKVEGRGFGPLGGLKEQMKQKQF